MGICERDFTASTIPPLLQKMVGEARIELARNYFQQILSLPWLPLHHSPLHVLLTFFVFLPRTHTEVTGVQVVVDIPQKVFVPPSRGKALERLTDFVHQVRLAFPSPVNPAPDKVRDRVFAKFDDVFVVAILRKAVKHS